MPHTQKRKCSVNFGELISFLSMREEYSLSRVLNEAASEEAGDTFFEHYYFIFHSRGQRFSLQQLQGLFDGLVRQAEGSIMHGHHPARFQIEEGAGGVGGAGMDVAELRRIVGADGEERQFGREAATDFAEAGEVGGVSGVVDGVFAAAQHVAAVAAVRILEDARSPMARGDMGDVERAVAVGVPPLQFDYFLEAEIVDQVE